MKIMFLLFIINYICINSKGENIFPYVEKNFMLTNNEPMKIYNYYPRITDLNHETIVQINSTYNGNAYICTGYFLNSREENIVFNFSNKEFLNCQKKFLIKNIEYITEYNITFESNSTEPKYNGYYFIGLYIDKMSGQDFSGSISAFTTNLNITINHNLMSNYFYFKNNYSFENYTFIIYPNILMQRYINIQIGIINNKNLFSINVIKNNSIIEEKANISSFNNFYDLLEDNYTINILFLKENKNLENLDFAIYFEYSQINKNILPLIDNNVNEINFLVKSDYYFYQIINDTNYNDKFYYIVSDFTLKRGMVSLTSQEYNIELNDINNNTYFKNLIYSSNFSACKSRYNWNSFTFFKCLKRRNESNIIIIKVVSTGTYPLNIRKIHFKELKRTIIDRSNNDYYYKSFNSQYLIDKIGYIYIKKINDNIKKQLLYCSKDNTMTVYSGELDLVEFNNVDLFYDKVRLFKLSDSVSDYEPNNFIGFTIITFNKDINYFIQLVDINKDIYDNLSIERLSDVSYLNKEYQLEGPTKNYYYFVINEYNEECQDIILDAQVLFGTLDIKYIDIDSISEKDFNISKIILFNENDNDIKDANHPIIIKKTTELIRITNNNYNSEYYNKAKIYLNKYLNKEIKKLNSLIPIYLNPFETKIFSLENIYGNVEYAFKLGSNYSDYTNDKDENLISINIGNNYFFNLTVRNYYIKGNISYINFGYTIKFINNNNRSILIWNNLGDFKSGNEYIKSLYLSKNYYYLYTFSLVHKLCFDWFNIKEKIKFGLTPKKVIISLLNEQQTKANGYYYQVMNIGDDNSDFIFYYSSINSIYYELDQGESLIFRSNDINMTEMDFYFKEKKYINFMIYPSSGLPSILFYIEYIFDISNYNNQLKFLKFDDSVYSINLKIDNNFIINNDLYNNNNYLFFQCLSCYLAQSNVTFKYNKDTFSEDNNNNNDNKYIIKTISMGNIIGYINLNNFSDRSNNDNLYINIIKPYQTYIKYYYTSNININYVYQNNYNINIEKDNSQNDIVLSFDCFMKKIKTNYTILILNKTEIKKQISNECEFLSYLEKRNNITSMKYLSFIDMNENIRIKKDISFDKIGNYAIYILAQTIDNFSIYKYLGTESYSYTKLFQTKTNNEKIDNMEIIAILIFIILIVILIILYFVFRYIRKNKIKRLFYSINSNSLLPEDLDNLKSSLNKLIEHKNINDKNNTNNDNNFLLLDKPCLEDEKENEKKNNIINNNMENNDNEYEQGQSAAPLLGDTYCSEEDRIKNELAKINKPSNTNKINNKEKMYINTNKGDGYG